MSEQYILALDDPQADLQTVGGKGASLARLANASLPVPGGFNLTTAAYRRFVEANGLQERILAELEAVDTNRPSMLETAAREIQAAFLTGQIPGELASAIIEAYSELPGHNPAVAVRSSATAEDLPGASFAGQQETFLNVSGADEVLEATQKCWASLWTARAIGYRARQGIRPDSVALAVVVQLLVPAESAGILFTVNPVNGSRDQMVINAAWGLGEAVVGGAVNPDTIVVDKDTGEILERQTADKERMTVRVNGGTAEQPVPENLRRVPVLSDQAVQELAQLGLRIERLYGQPVDIEWARADGEFAIVQARPVTALSEPRPAPPQEWEVPNPRARYLRNNIVELMPDPLTPLFATFGRRVINEKMTATMAETMGSPDLLPDELIVSINGYAYYNGEFSPAQIGRILLNSVGIMRRMFTGMEARWQEGRRSYRATLSDWMNRPLEQLPAEEILGGAERLMGAAIEYYTAAVGGIIPAAWISEALFSIIYQRLVQRKGDPDPATFLLGFDSRPILAEKSLYDLARWADRRPELAETLLQTRSGELAEAWKAGRRPSNVTEADWHAWVERFGTYLEEHGGTIYNLDFAQPTPADDPVPLFETVKLFLRGQGTNPYERQAEAVEKREQAIRQTQARLGRLRRSWFDNQLERAQKYAPLREDSLSEIGLGYPLLRRMLLDLGARIAKAGGIETPVDIFWLREEEARRAAKALDGDGEMGNWQEAIRQRKDEWRSRKQVTPPVALPLKKKFLGIEPDRFGLARTGAEAGNVIQGTPCSPGRATGVARVLHGPADFGQMQPGDVLVASITTPAWTPLFALASAIVTDVGGPLSHGSIVAREYAIPAVLGTGVATRRIISGQTVTVDGAEGKVYLEKESQPPAKQAEFDWPMPDPKGKYMRASIVDIMPDPLSPLFATMGVSIYNRAMQQMLADFTGRKAAAFPDKFLVPIRDYAYLSANYRPGEWWAMLAGLAPRMPRLIRNGPDHFRNIALPEYVEKIDSLNRKSASDMSAEEIWRNAKELTAAAMYYLSILQVDTLGASAGSEGLFTAIYRRYFKRDGDPYAPAFLMGYNTMPIRFEKSLYDLAQWAREHPELADYILNAGAPEISSALSSTQGPAEVQAAVWDEWKQRVDAHLETFGHMIYDLDFAKSLPAEDPTAQLKTMKMFMRGEGMNPYERQERLEHQREQATRDLLERARGLRGWAVRKTLGWAQSLGKVREDSYASIGLAYPRVRELLQELGRRMVDAEAIVKQEDIFWLEEAEIENRLQALERVERLESLQNVVEIRKEMRKAEGKIVPPPQLPPSKTYLGIPVESFIPTGEGGEEGGRLKGVGASGGRVTGVACVLHGPEDFDEMEQGGILVAKLTTPAWTPLFAMAAGVVTDIGGPLSHGSIVAREYGIPAVLGTGAATRIIQSGQKITVDGTEGIVLLEDGDGRQK